MPVRSATGKWSGDLRSGQGTVSVESGTLSAPYSFPSRFEAGTGTNPEELLAAAHAGCYAMALSNELSKVGFVPEHVTATAKVHLSLDGGAHIARIDLTCRASVPGIDAARFSEIAAAAKTGCPIGQALAAVDVQLDAALVSDAS